MINFPIFKHLSVTGFALYPGSEAVGTGLHINFRRGLTLVLGANGLGKTTLVNILYRLLAGAYDIPGLAGSTKLGNMALEAKGINRQDKSLFANRVADGATEAQAILTVQIGSHEVVISRNLQNLDLLSFEVDGVNSVDSAVSSAINEVKHFQATIQQITGVSSFGDWILLLRHLVFYFEDRRALVWDASAQKEILRILFLSNDISKKWAQDSREILELDSRMRNLRNALNREQTSLSQSESKSEAGAATLQQVRALEDILRIQHEKLLQLQEEFVDIDALREDHRLRMLTAQQERENASRAVERLKLLAITESFPKMSDTMRFILSHLLTENECLACGSHAPQAAKEYLSRLDNKHCVVCNTSLKQSELAINDEDSEFAQSLTVLRKSEDYLVWAQNQFNETEKQYQHHIFEKNRLEADTRARSSELNKLIKSLPPEEGKLQGLREDINKLNMRVAEQINDIKEKKDKYRKFVDSSSSTIAAQALPITESFNSYAEGFLLEECQLIWSPQKLKVGETGDAIDFPSFDLRMAGADFQSAVLRSGPDHVSESQREFIDLAFRMAMMEVAGAKYGSSLLIDAPESSLDAVFVTRAANVLVRFANSTVVDNRLIITSNLVEGQLIPHLISNSAKGEDIDQCVVNLFNIAAPTAAVKKLKPQYDAVLEDLLKAAKKLKAS